MSDPPEPDDEASSLSTGPRRSTYTPPPAGTTYVPGSLTDGVLSPPATPPAASSAMSAAEIPGVPPPPERASLSDDELLAAADPATAPGGTSALLDLFEQQLELRADEAKRLLLWERAVRDSGIAAADQIVESVRSGFTGVIDVIPTGDAPVDPWERYPGATAPPALTADDREPTVVPPVAPLGDALGAALAEAPPPYGLMPSAAVPPPLDESAFASAPVTTSGSLTAVPVPDTATPSHPSSLRVEASALEPTPVALRAGRSIRLFWLWFAVNASVVSIGLGAVLATVGMSLRQAILAALVGVAASFLPFGLGTLAGKWSGQPTMVVSRATFGIVGNLVPAVLAVVTRLLWAAVLLGMLGAGVAESLRSSSLVAGVDLTALPTVVAAVALILAATIAGFGFGMIVVVGAVASAVSAVLVIVVILLTASAVDLDAALTIPDGDWILVVTGAILVFSVVGLAWANSSGDLARYQSKSTIGASAVLWTSFGATVPAFALTAWGATLASSDAALGAELATNPVGAISGLLPSGLALPLALAVAVSLLAAAALALYSGGFALLATGLRASRPVSVLIAVVLTAVMLATFVAGSLSLEVLLRDVLTTLAVPVAAWAGIFGAETMIRTRRVHSPSLLRSGGVYAPVRWVNTVMLGVASALGWGFTSAQLAGLDWQGYLWSLAGGTGLLAQSDAGVAVALLAGLLTPIVAGIPALKRLQAAEYAAAADS